jgi:hypothetical protein
MMNAYLGMTEHQLATILNEVSADLSAIRVELLALRVDFSKHDHGNTASYVEAHHTIRTGAAVVTGAYTSTGSIALTTSPPAIPAG